jgi:hypothetical protein
MHVEGCPPQQVQLLEPSPSSPLSYAVLTPFMHTKTTQQHSYDILGARMLWKPKEARILKNFIEF